MKALTDLKSIDIMLLQAIPDHIADEELRLLDNCKTTIVSADRDCVETWQVAVIVNKQDGVSLRGVGRVLVNVVCDYKEPRYAAS